MALIVIDPGHGGTDPGTSGTGPAKTPEKNINLQVALHLSDILNPDNRAEITRRDDSTVKLTDRPLMANRLKADLFVSIHFNASENHNAQGTETYYHTNATPKQQELAKAVHSRVVTATGLTDRGVLSKDLFVINPAKHHEDTICCLVEASFLDRPDEEKKLLTQAYQKKIAQAIADGIKDYQIGRSG